MQARLPPQRLQGGGGPIFVIGCMGSGTTLLRLVLDSHERIAIPRETAFMRAATANLHIPFWPFGGGWYKRLGLTREAYEHRLAAFYGELFSQYAESEGKPRWGEKTPSHLWHVDDMARLWPDAVFVGIVRHPGGNVVSNIGRFGHRPGGSARHYARYNAELLRQAARLGDRFAVVRYEELVLHTEPVMRELLDWLGEPWSPSVLEHHVQAGGEGAVIEGRNRVGDAIDTARVTRWTERLGETGRAKVARHAGPVGEFLGYTMEDPLRFASLVPGDDQRWLASGADIESRMGGFPELDLLTPGSAPLIDRRYRAAKVRVVPRAPAKPPPPPPPPPPRRRTRLARRLPRVIRRPLARAARRLVR